VCFGISIGPSYGFISNVSLPPRKRNDTDRDKQKHKRRPSNNMRFE
jgi:hypothetical protein